MFIYRSKRFSLVRRSARKTPNRSSNAQDAGVNLTHNSSIKNTPEANSTLHQSRVVQEENTESNRSIARKIPDESRTSNITSNKEQNGDAFENLTDDDLEEPVRLQFNP